MFASLRLLTEWIERQCAHQTQQLGGELFFLTWCFFGGGVLASIWFVAEAAWFALILSIPMIVGSLLVWRGHYRARWIFVFFLAIGLLISFLQCVLLQTTAQRIAQVAMAMFAMKSVVFWRPIVRSDVEPTFRDPFDD